MINLENLSLTRGRKDLLIDVSQTFFDGQKIGLVGNNGTGKTSLMMLLMGEIEPSEGRIRRSEQLRIAHVAQEMAAGDIAALDYVLQGDTEYWDCHLALAEAERSGQFDKLGELHERMSVCDGYTAHARAGTLLSHFGFDDAMQARSVAHFSGGWRVRLNLARVLFAPSDLLLLDEPTNHLDLSAIIWLEKWLQDYPGTLIMTSHDREFLDKVISHVAHIDRQSIKLYTGNYSQFEDERMRAMALQQKTFEKQQAKIKHMMRFVKRFGAKATKAKQAQSRLKQINKMESVAAVHIDSPIQFEFFEAPACPNPLLTLNRAEMGYGETTVLSDVGLQVIKGDRIGLLGENGAGKSTLIKSLIGELPLLSGERIISSKVSIGYFAQHQLEHLDLSRTPIAYLRDIASGETDAKLRAYLGSFGFSGDRIFDPVENFSGGEKSRLVLSLIIWQRPMLLLLDEPTNHLDLETRTALMLALQNFTGSLVLVSHDRYLMSMISDTLWLVEGGHVQPFDGSLADYQKHILTCDKPSKPKSVKTTSKPKKADHSRRLAQIEKLLTKYQGEIEVLEATMCATLQNADSVQTYQSLQTDKEKLEQTVAELEQEWITLSES